MRMHMWTATFICSSLLAAGCGHDQKSPRPEENIVIGGTTSKGNTPSAAAQQQPQPVNPTVQRCELNDRFIPVAAMTEFDSEVEQMYAALSAANASGGEDRTILRKHWDTAIDHSTKAVAICDNPKNHIDTKTCHLQEVKKAEEDFKAKCARQDEVHTKLHLSRGAI